MAAGISQPGLAPAKDGAFSFLKDTVFVNPDRKSATTVNGLNLPLNLEIYGDAIIFG